MKSRLKLSCLSRIKSPESHQISTVIFKEHHFILLKRFSQILSTKLLIFFTPVKAPIWYPIICIFWHNYVEDWKTFRHQEDQRVTSISWCLLRGILSQLKILLKRWTLPIFKIWIIIHKDWKYLSWLLWLVSITSKKYIGSMSWFKEISNP